MELSKIHFPLFFAVIVIMGMGCADPQKKIDAVNALPKTTVIINESEFDFGTLKQGDHVKHSFEIKNTGTNPLVIGLVKTSCSCTSSDWSNEPVAPGMTATVTLDLDTDDKEGTVNKSGIIFMNIEEQKMKITVRGIVEK